MAEQTPGKVSMEKLVSLSQRRGFIFPSSEIYGGLSSCWDYGPLGVELKRNIKEAWWRAAVQERDGVYIIGVDNDWAIVNEAYADVTLTSILKNMDKVTFAVIESVIDGTFEGGLAVGTLENGGVGLAPFHNLESLVSAELQAELADVAAKIIAGEIATKP